MLGMRISFCRFVFYGVFFSGRGRDVDCGVELYNYSIYLKNLNIFLKS